MKINNVSKNELLAVISRLFQGLSLLVSLQLVVSSYGADAYGFMSLCISFTAYLTMFDFGITSSLRSALPNAYREYGETTSNQLAKVELFKLVLISSPFYIIMYIIINKNSAFLMWFQNTIVKNGNIDLNLIQTGLSTIIVYSAIMLLCNFTIAVMSARQKQYKYYIYLIIGHILQIFALYLTTRMGLDASTALPIMLLTPFMSTLVIIISVLYPLINISVDQRSENRTNNQSKKYFLIQTCGQIVNSVDVIIVAYFFTLKEVAIYSTLKLVIQVPQSIHASYILQTWSLLAAHNIITDKKDIIQILLKKIRISLAASLACCILIITAVPKIVEFITDSAIILPLDITLLFCVYLNIAIIGSCLTILSYAFNYTNFLTMLAPVSVIAMVGISYFGIQHYNHLTLVIISSIIIQFFGIISGLKFYRDNLC